MRSWRSLIEWEPSEWLSIKRRFGAGAVTRVKWYSGLFILNRLYHWLGCAFDFTNTTTTHRVSACTQTRMCRNAGPPRGTVRVTSRERRASSGRVDYGKGGGGFRASRKPPWLRACMRVSHCAGQVKCVSAKSLKEKTHLPVPRK